MKHTAINAYFNPNYIYFTLTKTHHSDLAYAIYGQTVEGLSSVRDVWLDKESLRLLLFPIVSHQMTIHHS